MEREVDVAIIGAGTSGLNAMSQVRKAGKSFVLINGGYLGTTCARVGCMPSKAFIQVAQDYHRREVFDRHAIEGGETLSFNMEDALEHVRDMRDIFVDRVLDNSTDNLDADHLIEGYAEFVEPRVLQVGDQRIRAGKVVIATGSRPVVPEAWKRFGDRVITTDDIFEQEVFPKTMAVVGLGVIGLELGQALHRMGVEVTGIDALETIGGLSDPVTNGIAVEIFSKEFPIWLGQPAEISEQGDYLKVTAGENNVLVEQVLVSIGRRPNLDRLHLDRLGVELDDQGVPRFDPHTMQVASLPVFIAGDTAGDRAILHEAGDEGKIAGYNAAHDTVMAFRRKTPLAITFCDPNLVTVGARWSELQDRNDVAVGEMRLGPVGRALIMGKNRGVIRVYAEQGTGKLLGAALVSPRGENLGHLLAWSIQQDLTVYDLIRMPFYHPVIEEALQAALYNLLGNLDGKPSGLLELAPLEA
jgi:dihydrolipoamide dehydrogenase